VKSFRIVGSLGVGVNYLLDGGKQLVTPTLNYGN
jgi:hypothetical protein